MQPYEIELYFQWKMDRRHMDQMLCYQCYVTVYITLDWVKMCTIHADNC